MKTIGILGGVSAASTQIYYRTLCDLTQDKFGGLTSLELLIRSLDFAPLAASMNAGDWTTIASSLNREARRLCDGGADLILLASNTMHKLADEVMAGIDIPLLHIADTTGVAVADSGC
jgi:aspartate racemase